MAEFGLEDLLGRIFARLEPDLVKISEQLFRIESGFKAGILTPESFAALRLQLAEIRFAIENLELVPIDTRQAVAAQSGVRFAS